MGRRHLLWLKALLLSGLALLASCSADAPVRPDSDTAAPASRTVAAAPKRLALVIGNGRYKDSPLINPPNDARAMAAVLTDLGFKVTKLEDATLKQMNVAVRDFGDTLRKNGGVGLFFYAGHGIQIRGRNYLVPVDADIQREDEVPFAAFDANAVLDKMESAGNGTNIIILDACRNNPFARSFRSSSTGLAQMDAPVGTYISFATAPGRVASDGSGANGLYTQHIISSIRQPGLKIEDVFKRARVGVMSDSNGQQVPWDNSSLTGDFFFIPATANAAPTEPAATKSASAPAPAPQQLASRPAPLPAPPPASLPPQATRASESPPPATTTAKADEPVRTEKKTPVHHDKPPAPPVPVKQPPTQVAMVAPPRASGKEPPKEPPTQLAMATPPAGPSTQKPGSGGEDLYRQAMEAQKKQQAGVAADLFQQAADLGNPGAQYELGHLYKIGRKPVNQDLAKARALFGKAAPHNLSAAYEYGSMLDKGLGGERNCKEGQRWLSKASEAGNVDAMYVLGESLLRACDGEKNAAAAAKWFRAAADKSSVNAQFSLGLLYFNGDGVPKSPADAKKWLELAASNGHPSARFYLDRLN
jgi:uncharacterized caspase-like protein